MKTLDRLMRKLRKPIIGKSLEKKGSYSSRSYIESFLKKYDSPSIYQNLFEECYDKSSLATKTNIRHSKKIKFGDSLSDIVAIKNSNSLIIKEMAPFSLLFSRTRIGNYKAKSVMSFYNMKLFAYNYSFSCLDEEDRSNIIGNIHEKYLDKNSSFDIEKNSIIDQFGNCLLIEDQVNLTIYYTKLKEGIYNNLLLLSKEEKENKALLAEYQKNELQLRL
ncbi:MAG: hypothetical protein JKY48_03500 [Flavobacteriales bacterium]|nr:hypothetical protein [Flavobacteriales bacterium]